MDNTYNTITNSKISGDFIGGNYHKSIINNTPYEHIFNKTVFLHYLGNKVSKYIFGNQFNLNQIINNTKIIVLFFDDILVSLSDVTQSPLIFNTDFFSDLLSEKYNEKFLISIAGNKTSQKLDEYLSLREEYYHKPGFYDIINETDMSKFFNNIKDSHRPKEFNTGNYLSYKWNKTFSNIYDDKDILENNYINYSVKNLYINNIKYFQSSQSDEILLIPEKLNGFPFIWDSVKYLELISKKFDDISVKNIEIYLATEWISCYLQNYNAYIPNKLIGLFDCSFGVNRTFDFSFIIKFLQNYHILELIQSLDLLQLLEVKEQYSKFLSELIELKYNNLMIINNPIKVDTKIKDINNKEKSVKWKIENIITVLYENKK